MPRPAFELADIFRQHGEAYRQSHSLPLQPLRVMRAIEVCRTAVLGGHVEKCDQCDYTHISYNSCRGYPLGPPLSQVSKHGEGEVA